ncbi:unnamed protein product [Brassica rapa]|uniref:C2H2-type domain-containing protein n=3 Tax=Brassica TaxID=3705 RepID=A0A8D9D7V6_BRACM|nr:unnamed protein product [Brassica rapa]
MLAAAGGSDGSSRHGLYGGASSGLSHNHFGDNSNSGFAPPAAGFNLNRSSSPKFEDFFPQSTNPNHGPTTNFPMQYPSNQGLLARNDQNLMNQHGLINSNNNNNNLFNPGYFQANTQNLSDQTGGPPLFHHADNNVPSALLRGSSMAANNFGGSGNSNFQGQMNSLAATSGHQGRPGSSIFDHRLGNNLSIGGPDRRTLDFLGVNGRGGRSEPPLDLDMKFSDPNNPFGNKMSSSYNNTISSSSTQSFPLLAIGANNFNREETAMTMNQQRPNSVSPPPRRLRNKPGNPSPDAEVIALTPEEIMATNRFQCEVCEKGFQRQQNLQLHRRGHNLPFNLKQKSDEEIRRKVYVCPEPTCVYHDPSRALGDLTGIKKHYCRKHGEKKFKCEKCDKFYAVESDCKAHSMICGTKEYRCVCGTKFSRSDSYETHRAFCEALAQESAGNPNLSFTEMLAAAGGSDGSSRDGLYGGASSALSHNHFGDNSNSGFAPPGAGFNLNRSSSPKFEDFFPQSTNPNHGPTTNFPMQYPSNQGLLARNDQNLMNQHGLINNNNVPSAQLRGSSVAANNFGGSGNVNFQGQMNSLAATSGQQGRPGSSIFDHRLGNNLSIEGPDRRTLDFLGVNGRGGRNEPPLDLDMKFSDPNNPFGNV